jgi:hypothetical protein
VRIARLLYDRNIELSDLLPRFNRALAAAPRLTEGTVVELGLIVDAPGELFVENNLTRMEARARLSLNGTVAHPVLMGASRRSTARSTSAGARSTCSGRPWISAPTSAPPRPEHQRREPDRHARRHLRGRRAGDRHDARAAGDAHQ